MEAIKTNYELGKMNNLIINRIMPQGAYLNAGEDFEILLPKRYMSEDAKEGDELEVFIYHDNEARLTATTLRPLALVGETKALRCVSTSNIGAFFSLGIHKDILLPFSEQVQRIEIGMSYPLHIYIDKRSGKIVASQKLHKHIGNTIPSYKAGDEVTALIVERTNIGYKVVADNIHWAMIYYNEVDHPLGVAHEYKAYVVRSRDDGKLDLSIKPIGYDKVAKNKEQLLSILSQNNGILNIGDKSDAEEILRQTGFSKKTFKMIVGSLYKERLIEISDYKIALRKK